VLQDLNPAFRLLDGIDHWILLRRNLAALELEHYRRLAEPGRFLSDFEQFFSRCQDELVTPEDYEAYVAGLRAKYEGARAALDDTQQKERAEEIARQEEIARAYRTSSRLLRERNLVTFGALLLETVQQFRSNAALLEHYQHRFRYILVDEFQDTNIAQIELLWLLAGRHRNIVAVGDDDQAIYRFRGASYGSFLLFLERFTGHPAGTPESLRYMRALTQNYRSTRIVLRAAGHVIRQNYKTKKLPPKVLTTENPGAEKIRIAEFGEADQEATWIADELDRMHRAGRGWGEFAVLYRAHAHRDLLVEILTAREIPFVIRKLSILETTLVRDVMAYLRQVAHPGDDVACARVLAAPAWGLGAADVVRLAERAAKARGQNIWGVLDEAQAELAFLRDRKRTAELVNWMAELRRRARELPAAEFTESLIADFALVLPADDPNRAALDRFLEFAREWEKKSETETVREFVDYLEYFREAGGEVCFEEGESKDAVQLMTVHAAKGLEFDRVFVMRMVQNQFPTSRRRPVLEFPPELMKEEKPEGDFHVQEERRLFYVAMTRAKKQLTLTTVVKKRSRPSVFLDELLEPGEHRGSVEQLAPKVVPATESAAAAMEELFGRGFEQARAYSRIVLWARQYRPPVAEPLQLSASAIEIYNLCPQKYLFEQRWGIRGRPAAAMAFGNVMHTTVREFVRAIQRGRRMPFDEVEAIFKREWPSARFRDSYQEQEYQKEGLAQLRGFYERYVAAPADVLEQEKWFELPLEENVVVTGRIDQLNRVDGNEVEIVDYKTGRPKEEKDAEKSLQLSLYALAMRELLELDPVRLTFYNLTTNEPVSAPREEKQLEEARKTVLEVAAQIRAGHFPAKPGYHCRMCEYHSLCPAQEQLIAIRPAGG